MNAGIEEIADSVRRGKRYSGESPRDTVLSADKMIGGQNSLRGSEYELLITKFPGF